MAYQVAVMDNRETGLKRTGIRCSIIRILFLLWLTVSRGLVIEDNNNPFSPMDGSRVITDDVSPN
jgi:hypothetical protein